MEIILTFLSFTFYVYGQDPPDVIWFETDNVFWTDEVEYAFDICVEKMKLARRAKFDWLKNYSFPVDAMMHVHKVKQYACVINELKLIEEGRINVDNLAILLSEHDVIRPDEIVWLPYFRYVMSLSESCITYRKGYPDDPIIHEGKVILSRGDIHVVENILCIKTLISVSKQYENPFDEYGPLPPSPESP